MEGIMKYRKNMEIRKIQIQKNIWIQKENTDINIDGRRQMNKYRI
jgi:hypothetical protein